MAESDPLLPEKLDDTAAPFTLARRGKPQCIAHRGYKAAYPENTMGAFEGAVGIGAHAIETDLHLSKDGVVVISHDADLKRCFGRKEKIIDCDWSFLQTLQTLREPHQSMPRLKDLLGFLTKPGLEDIWLLLDLKPDNDADDLMRLVASTLAEVKPSRPWNQRVVLGCWAANWLPHCEKYLPGYPITHIGFNISYARQFLKVPGVSFNMFQKIMVGPFGEAFLRDIRKAKRAIFLWTVNDEESMKWSIYKEVDGVISDDPKKYLEVCEKYQGEKIRVGLKSLPFILFLNMMVTMVTVLLRYRFGSVSAVVKAKKVVEGAAPRVVI